MGAAGEQGAEGAGAGGDGAGAGDEYFKCLHCSMAEGFYSHAYVKKHKAVHVKEIKKAREDKAKQVAARKKKEAARGKPARKAGKGKPGKKAGKGSSRKSGAHDNRCTSK